MTDEQILKIIDALLNATFLDNWYFYLILFSVSLLGGLAGAYIKSYGSVIAKYTAIEKGINAIRLQAETTEIARFTAIEKSLGIIKEQAETTALANYTAIEKSLDTIKKQAELSEKAKYTAIEESLDTIKKQIKVTTETSEGIKQTLAHDNWRKKELETLKRNKLEDYCHLILKIKYDLVNEMRSCLYDENLEFDSNIVDKAALLQSLYLPEIFDQHRAFSKTAYDFQTWIYNGQAKKHRGGQEWPDSDYISQMHDLLMALHIPQTTLLKTVNKLASEINL